jgi:hypothetical protein
MYVPRYPNEAIPILVLPAYTYLVFDRPHSQPHRSQGDASGTRLKTKLGPILGGVKVLRRREPVANGQEQAPLCDACVRSGIWKHLAGHLEKKTGTSKLWEIARRKRPENGKPEGLEYIYWDSPQEILQRQHCPFCRLVVSLLGAPLVVSNGLMPFTEPTRGFVKPSCGKESHTSNGVPTSDVDAGHLRKLLRNCERGC